MLRRLLVEWLRVPPEPQPPPGSPETLRVFRAAPAFYYYSVLKWAMKQAGAIFGIFLSLGGFGLTIGRFEGLPIDAPLWIETAAIAIFSFQAVGSFLLIRLNYELRWYMVSDRSLRIREGIFRITEQTMTVANIQNMAVRQGPLQRLLGIADLHVRTAGGAGSEEKSNQTLGEDPHLGTLRGVDNAERIRDLIADSLRRYRDSGLGDPDDDHDGPSDAPSDEEVRSAAVSAPAAAARVLDEVRALRAALAGRL